MTYHSTAGCQEWHYSKDLYKISESYVAIILIPRIAPSIPTFRIIAQAEKKNSTKKNSINETTCIQHLCKWNVAIKFASKNIQHPQGVNIWNLKVKD